jgi:hypothetical protein
LKANGSDVLFVVTYSGKGASEKQFIETFATAGIRVVFARATSADWPRCETTRRPPPLRYTESASQRRFLINGGH